MTFLCKALVARSHERSSYSNFWCLLVAFFMVTGTSIAHTQEQPPSKRKSKHELSVKDVELPSDTTMDKGNVRPMFQVARVLREAQAAADAGRHDVEAYKVAWAILATRTYAQRDTLERRLQTLVNSGAWGPIGRNQSAQRIARVLDSTFQLIYDRELVVERAPLAVTTESHRPRTVLAEYITGIQCGPCWAHDRVYALLLQRYTASQVVVIGYHDGPGAPIARPSDSLWKYIGGNYDTAKVGLYPSAAWGDTVPYGDWVDGTPNGRFVEELKRSREADYHYLREVIDRRRAVAPGAVLSLALTPVYDRKKTVSAIRVLAKATPLQARKRLGVRFVLVQDTVRVTGYSPRRLQYMAARTVSWFPGKKLFFMLPEESVIEHTVSYTFDVATLQRELLETLQRAEQTDDFYDQFRRDFPSPQDWMLNSDRLGVVAIVQDLETLEVLQTVYQPLQTAGKKSP